MEVRPGCTNRILAEIVSSSRTIAAALILPNGLQYARGRDPSTGEVFRRTPRRESPPLPPAALVDDKPPQRVFPRPERIIELTVPERPEDVTKTRIPADSKADILRLPGPLETHSRVRRIASSNCAITSALRCHR